MTPEMLLYTLTLSFTLLAVGTAACLPLFRFDIGRFFSSSLWTKIIMWIPILCLFLGVIYLGEAFAVTIALLLVVQAVREYYPHFSKSIIANWYVVLFILSSAHIAVYYRIVPPQDAVATLLVICFGSVLSDVIAFFAGTYAGKHHLPQWINTSKSYEGVAGQIVGAIIGVLLVSPIAPGIASLSIALVIGVSSAFGDVFNSAAKRSLGIKDWSHVIPGHGGAMDRMSSLNFALAITSWYIVITQA